MNRNHSKDLDKCNRLQSIGSDLLKYITTFISGYDLDQLYYVCSEFRLLMRDDAKLMYRYVYKRWVKFCINEIAVAPDKETYKDFLDISIRDNGDIMFFLPDLRAKSKISYYDFADFVYDHSELFVDAGRLFDWEIKDGKFYDHERMMDDFIYHKYLVKPIRIYNLGKIDVLAVKLEYFPYLRITTENVYDGDVVGDYDIYMSYNVNITLFLRNFQKFLLRYYSYVFSKNSKYFIEQFIKIADTTRSQFRLFEESPGDYIYVRDILSPKELLVNLQRLISDRKNDKNNDNRCKCYMLHYISDWYHNSCMTWKS